MSESSKLLIAGVDDGFDETKVVMSDGTVYKMASRAKAGESNHISIGEGNQDDVYAYRTSDGNYIVGDDIDRADATASDDYPLSTMNRAVVTHALRMAGAPGDAQMALMTGLPVKKYYLRGKMNKGFISQKKANLLTNDVRAADGTALPAIVKHDVISEGIAAWMDHIIQRNDQGRLEVNKNLAGLKIGIVDIGGRTTDIAVVQNWKLDVDRSSTVEVGMIAIREAVRQAIYESTEVDVNDAELRRALTQGAVKMWGKLNDVSEIVGNATRNAINQIRSETKRRLGSAADLDEVIFVGGTVVAIAPYLKDWFPNQALGTDPSFANARGMAKFAEMTWG